MSKIPKTKIHWIVRNIHHIIIRKPFHHDVLPSINRATKVIAILQDLTSQLPLFYNCFENT